MRAVRAFIVGCCLATVACGDDDSSAPPRFPAVAGTYRIEGTFDALPAANANLTGTITLTQPSRNDAALTGAANVTLVLTGSTPAVLTTVTNATVNEAGAVTFELPPPNATSRWVFTGSATPGVITGTHTLIPATGPSFGGRFTATRQ